MINVGDMANVLTNGRYKAPMHRVLASGAEPRYSVAFFFNPTYDADCAPLPPCVDAAHPPIYRWVPQLTGHLRRPSHMLMHVGDSQRRSWPAYCSY